MGQHGRAGGDRQDEGDQLERGRVGVRDTGGDESGGGGQGDGRRALCDAEDGGDDEGGDDQRKAEVGQGVGERGADAAVAQHAAEHPARAGDQDDRADRAEGVVEQRLDLPARVAADGEGVGRHEERDEQRDGRLADEDDGVDEPALLGDGPVGAQRGQHGVGADEHQWQEQDPEHVAERRRVLDLGVAPAREHGVVDGYVDLAEPRGRDDVHAGEPRDHGHDDADQQREADARTQLGRGGHRTGVRRDDGVHGREGAGGRKGVHQHGAAEALGDREDDRQEDDEAGVEEDREAEEQRRDAQGHGRPLLAEAADEGVGEHLRPAGHLEQPADHHAEAHQEGHGAERAAEGGDGDRGHLGEGYAGGDGGAEADQHERHEGVHAQHDDEQEQDGDGDRCDEQERAGAVDGVHGVHERGLRDGGGWSDHPRPTATGRS